jgi:signal transduction histidine kinase
VGLESALGWYIDGFSARSGIQTSLTMRKDFGRLGKEQEITLFRVVQEALTNVLRHSGSTSAQVELRRVEDRVELDISDRGKGIAPAHLAVLLSSGSTGVGLGGMRERLSQFGGNLSIRSSEQGTRVSAKIPLERSIPQS